MISVIIPVYNVEKYLHICINSILNQSFQDFEIICIDDGSLDSSSEILEYFANKDSRIKIFKNERNLGLSPTRNRGMDIAKGKYILFLDADDWYCSDALEILFTEAEKNNLDIVIAKAIVYYEDKQRFGLESHYNMNSMNKFYHKVFNHEDLNELDLLKIPVAVWSKLYLKSFLTDNKIRFPNENYINEDNPFSYKVFIKARRMAILNKYVYTRRRRDGSLITLKNERLFDSINIVDLILNVFLENDEIYQRFKLEVLTLIFVIILNEKYHQIEKKYKAKFFHEVQGVYRRFIEDYGLYEDIKENVDNDILNFFEFENIAKNLLE